MSSRHRPYTGSLDYAASLARSAAEWTEREAPDLARRLWTEDNAQALVTQHVSHIRESLARMQLAIAEIEATLTTVGEEQEAAKETLHAAA